MSSRGLLAGAALLAAGCATADRSAEAAAVAQGRYADALPSYEAHIAEGGAEVTLDQNLAGTAALLAGDVGTAHRHFAEAFADLDDLTATTGETVAATAGSAQSRRWKGDPHERSMNAYYLGVTYWLLGDADSAAACFKAGLLRDADSEEGAAQSDFGVLWFLLGHAQRAARHTDGGAHAFGRAKALLRANPYAEPAHAAEANLVLVFETGDGPRKVATGAHGAQLQVLPGDRTAADARVAAGERDLGTTSFALDVHWQAVTRGGEFVDDVNVGKAVLKDASVIAGGIVLHNADNTSEHLLGAGLLLLGLLLPAEADVRSWNTLPGEVQVLSAKLPPGEHVLRVVPRSFEGGEIQGWSRSVPVTIREGRTAFVWCRASPPPVPRSAEGRP